MAQNTEQIGTFTCLIADDSQYARRTIAGIVSKMGGSIVAEAANGIDAVDQYARLRPDVVLLDITMPRLDGIDTLAKIMEHDRDAKVIIISSVGNREMVWKAIELGARSFLTKPYNADYAALIIRDVVNGGSGAAQ